MDYRDYCRRDYLFTYIDITEIVLKPMGVWISVGFYSKCKHLQS